MSEMRRIKRDHMRAILSEVLPFEAPLPFSTLEIFRFLKRIDFQWTPSPNRFTVDARKMQTSDQWWLNTLFDRVQLSLEGTNDNLTTYCVSDGKKPRTVQPYRFSTRRNNGKIRELVVLHPQSMIDVARYVHDYADSILYFTNRSSFSIRHPFRVARLEMKRDGVFEDNRGIATPNIEQHNLEYDHVTSYFTYRRYSNINRFYTSPEFQACERKYPTLMRADVSNCFPSIYTHTVSWVTNGRHVSKLKSTRQGTGETFGGKLDSLAQALNYGETSGIVIGPEFSRVFAEIILQEIDIRVERELADKGLKHGVHYEAMRYVDDYFFFLSRAGDVNLVEEILAKHLAHFKLHLNERKKEILTTPLRSEMSIAKYRIRRDLKRLTKLDTEIDSQNFRLFMSSSRAILEYKSALIDATLEHGEIANFYLYTLLRRASKSCKKSRKYLESLPNDTERRRQEPGVAISVARYLASVLDVAFFVYSGAPSPSHGVKLAQLILTSIHELRLFGASALDLAVFEDKMRREILAQLLVVNEAGSLGVHTLNLLDCYVHLKGEPTGDQLTLMLKQRNLKVAGLEVFEVLIFLRACGNRDSAADFRNALLQQASAIIEAGKSNPDFMTQRAILLLSLSSNRHLDPIEVEKMTGQSASEIIQQRESKGMSVFSWDVDDYYLERLLLKNSRMVY